MSRIIFTEEQKEYMRNNYLTMTYREIGDVLNLTERQVRGWVNHNCPKKNRTINDTYFDNIDTPLKAYFIGFLFADGFVMCNPAGHYVLGMNLQSEDRYILDALNSELGGTNLISHKDPHDVIICGIATKSHGTDELIVHSKKIVLSLINHNIVPNKTKNKNFPIVPDEFFFDFLRGYIDGDGWYTKDNRGNMQMGIVCSQKEPLEYVQSILNNYGIEARLYYVNERKYRLICYRVQDMKKLVDHLYYEDGLLCLCRKYEKIKHLLGLAA